MVVGVQLCCVRILFYAIVVFGWSSFRPTFSLIFWTILYLNNAWTYACLKPNPDEGGKGCIDWQLYSYQGWGCTQHLNELQLHRNEVHGLGREQVVRVAKAFEGGGWGKRKWGGVDGGSFSSKDGGEHSIALRALVLAPSPALFLPARPSKPSSALHLNEDVVLSNFGCGPTLHMDEVVVWCGHSFHLDEFVVMVVIGLIVVERKDGSQDMNNKK